MLIRLSLGNVPTTISRATQAHTYWKLIQMHSQLYLQVPGLELPLQPAVVTSWFSVYKMLTALGSERFILKPQEIADPSLGQRGHTL